MRVEPSLLLIGGAVGIYFWNKGKAANRLIFFPGAITDAFFENNIPYAEIELIVQNTSNVSIQLNSLAGNVFSSGTLVGNISTFTPVKIQSNSQGAVPILIRFKLLGIVNDLLNAFQYGNFQRELTIEGSVNAEGVAVPLSLTYKVGG
jgi:hypothetical protein